MSNLNPRGELVVRYNRIIRLIRIANGVCSGRFDDRMSISPSQARRLLDDLSLEKIGDLVQRGWDREQAINFVASRVQWARATNGRWSNWPIPGLANLGTMDDYIDLPF